MTRALVEGSAAIADALVRAGCRFFAGYPMTPFTEVLERMAEALPAVGGTCINAESEIEAIGMVWGAAAGGVRAATGSTGQGLSLMQESIAESALAGIGYVLLNMARGQGDYFQATRGGGHGDYRTPVLAPSSPAEAQSLVAEAFGLADRWRNPVLVMCDYYVAHTWVDLDRRPMPALDRDPPEWCLDGSTGGSGAAKLVSPLGTSKQRDGPGYDLAVHYQHAAEQTRAMTAGIEPLAELHQVADADVVIVAYGTMGRYAKAVVDAQRARGNRLGLVRPITLWPFPAEAVIDAATSASVVAVYENNAGQMIDDVRLALLGSVDVVGLNGYPTDSSAFGVSPQITVENLDADIDLLLRGAHP